MSGTQDRSPQAVMARARAARGDMFPEWQPVADAAPETVAIITRTGGYLHKYEGQGGEGQELSVQMRELIAVPAICGKGDLRHAANHVRRMYRMGMTDRVILEGATAFAIAAGWATMLNVALAITMAIDPDYPFGELPEGGAPTELVRFPELDLGRQWTGGDAESLVERPQWRFAASIDPGLVERIAAWEAHCLAPDDGAALLGPGPRELIAVAALSIRGEVEQAARHIARAYGWGMSRRQVLEAVSAAIPMTGLVTAEIGLAAMMRAEA